MDHPSVDQAANTARAELATTLQTTYADARDAQCSIGALVEILTGCGPEKQLTAMLFLGLLVPIYSQLENVRDGVRVMCQAEGLTPCES
jgi:hypothetical protein